MLFLQLNEPSNVKSQNTLITPELKIFLITDYGEINLNLNCNSCYIVNSGTSGGIITLSGKTNAFTFWARASLQINAEDFLANYVTITQESIANCSIHVNNELNIEVLNTGNIFYKGNPETINYVNEKAKNKLIKLDGF